MLLAGAAAFAYYKYNRMSSEEKSRLVNDIKDKGRKIKERFMPSSGIHDTSAEPSRVLGDRGTHPMG